MRRWTVVLATLVTATAVGITVPALAGGAVNNGNPAFAASLRKLVAMPGGPPGAIAVVQVGPQKTVVSAGVADVATKVAPTANEPARIASVSKAFNGAVTLALVSRGALSLDDTVGEILPTLPKAWSSVTVAQLLQHTSGVPDYIKSPEFATEFTADPLQSLTPNQLLDFVADDPLLFQPGSQYAYSDSDNLILGLMDGAKSGGTYTAALEKFVTKPLRLSSTYLPANADLTMPYLHGYDISTGSAPEDVSMAFNPALAGASGGMVSTAGELNIFIRAYAAGRLEGAAVRRHQLTFVKGSSGPPGPGTNSAGLAIYRYATKCGTVYGHTGNAPGYTIFAASNLKGTRSVDLIVSSQLSTKSSGGQFTALRSAEALGVCAALGK